MAAPVRTPVIKGRVLRNLTRRGVLLESVQDEEIYSELTNAQNLILDDITPHHDTRIPRSNPTATIDENTDPTLPGIWDKALEYKTTSEFLTGKEQEYYLELYGIQLKELRGSRARSDEYEPVTREEGVRGCLNRDFQD